MRSLPTPPACSVAAVTIYLSALSGCGGDGTGPNQPFPDVAGSYQIAGGFDDLSSSAGSFTGRLTLAQASRQASALAGAATLTLSISDEVFTDVDVPAEDASVTPAGVVSFRLGGNPPGSTWTFNGTRVRGTFSGRHTFDNGQSSFSGDWRGTPGRPTTGSLTVTSETSGPDAGVTSWKEGSEEPKPAMSGVQMVAPHESGP